MPVNFKEPMHPSHHYHDPNRHDSVTLICAALLSSLLGFTLGCLVTYHALT